LTSNEANWICFQLGAREHYVIPHALHDHQRLAQLVTDYWHHPGSPLGNKNLRGRFREELPQTCVTSFNNRYILFEGWHRVLKHEGWGLVMKRNKWFQQQSVKYLRSLQAASYNLFCYSYAAQDMLREARLRSWKTVLGQIDPGPIEEDIVLQEVKKYPQYRSEWHPAPQAYWDNWYQECELASEIIVNSEWSKRALIMKGIAADKLQLLPLLYSPSQEMLAFDRQYPNAFTKMRPMKVLVLGQVILRKGVARIIEAAQQLVHEPIEFVMAGPVGISPVPDLPNMKWLGRIPRIDVDYYFKNADVFLFPTLSDGFGLTQLEAQAWKLPAIVSKNCGSVVEHGVTGWVLDEITGTSIANVLREIINTPELLHRFGSRILARSTFQMQDLVHAFNKI
jgi:glycosyltransferase involved in cell wall biosynthesis